MKILQIHSRYSSSLSSGENSTVEELHEIFAGFAQSTLFNPSTNLLKIGHRNKFDAVRKYLSLDESTVEMAKDYDLVLLHNSIPIISAATVRKILSHTNVVRIWHNFRNSCISGNHFRKMDICHKCTESSLGKFSGIMHSCYRNSVLQSSIITRAEQQYAQVYSENILWHVGISTFMKDYIKDLGIDESKVRVIPNSIKSPVDDSAPQGIDFMMVGRIEAEKGFKQAIQAWQLLPYSLREGRFFHIVGDGSQLQELKNLAHSDDVVFHGTLGPESISKIASKCLVGIATSLWDEPFGKVAAEYLSYGLVTIATPRGGLVEIVKDAPGGIITRDTTIESIAAGMIQAIHGISRNKSDIKQYFLNNYTKGKISSRWLAFFTEVLNE